MPQTLLSEKYGSSNSIFDVKNSKNVSRSAFDYSRKSLLTADNGAIIPVDLFEVLPKDDITINIRYLLETLPLAVSPLTNYKIRTHWYFIKRDALWKGWQTFVTKGRSGSLILNIPHVNLSENSATGPRFSDDTSLTAGRLYSPFNPMGLPSFLGLPSTVFQGSSKDNYLPYALTDGSQSQDYFLTGKKLPSSVNLLPFMFYQKICRNYLPSNLLQDNKVWFPEDLADEWRIEYAGPDADAGNIDGFYFVPEGMQIPDTKIANFVPTVKDNCVNLAQLRYALYDNDIFTSAKPWLVRGSEETLPDVSIKFNELNMKTSFDSPNPNNIPRMGSVGTTTSSSNDFVRVSLEQSGLNNGVYYLRSGTSGHEYQNRPLSAFINSDLTSYLNSNNHVVSTGDSVATFNLTANSFRTLIALSVWAERNALTNGNYNSTIEAHFGSSPKVPEYEPYYIGGTSDVISFAQILQTSASTDSSPLGTSTGLGSVNSSGFVGRFHSDDYGYIMGVMIITPEVTYNSKIEHMWYDRVPEDIYWPELADLGYQPVLNREIFTTGDDNVDNDLFGWQTRYSYLKTRENCVRGMFSLPSSLDMAFSAYAQSRDFMSLPKLSNQFVTMSPNNLRRDYLAYPSQPAYKVQFASDISLVRALPYQSVPNTFGF